MELFISFRAEEALKYRKRSAISLLALFGNPNPGKNLINNNESNKTTTEILYFVMRHVDYNQRVLQYMKNIFGTYYYDCLAFRMKRVNN